MKLIPTLINENFFNTENGEFYFGNHEYIGAGITYGEVRKLKGKIDGFFENMEMGIQNLAFYEKEIDGHFYQVSFHFSLGKLDQVYITFEDGKQLTEMRVWKELKRIKQDNHTRYLHERMVFKERKYKWGKLYAFYSEKVNLGQINISYQ